MEFLDNPSNVTSCDAFLHRDFGHEENFLDDAQVNASGDNCPYALLVLAVQLLMEITTFLRESHQHSLRGGGGLGDGGGRSTRGHSEVAVQPEGHSAQLSGRRSHTAGASGHQAGSSALKATRRRLSILMPLFGPIESKEKQTTQGGNTYIELPDVRTENAETARNVDEIDRISISKGSGRRSARSGSFRQSFQFAPRSSKQEGSSHRMSIRISGSKDQSSHSPYHDAITDDGPRTGLRPESARKRDRLNETDQDDIAVSQLKRSPRRERLKTSLSSTATPIGCRSRAHTPTDSCSVNMPWIPAVIKFAKLTTFGCRHQPTCVANCFDRQQQQLRALLQAIRQVYSAPTETSFIASVEKLPESRRLRTTSTAQQLRNGPISHQYSSDSARTGEMQSIRSSPNNSSNNSGGSSDAENTGTGNDLQQEVVRGALKEACLRLGGSGLVDVGFDLGEGEPDASTSILHRVFAATGVDSDRKNGLHVKGNKRKESSTLSTGWREATTPIFDRFRRKGGHKRTSAGPSSAALYCGTEEGNLQAGQGGLSSLMNLSLLAGAGTGLAAASSSPSLARLLEFMKSGLVGASEFDEAQSEDDAQKTKVRPHLQNADSPELVYLDTQVHSLRSSFFNLLNKSAILLTNEQLEDIVPLAWELLLEADPELTSSAATFILFAAVKCPNFVQKLVYTELHHVDVNNRLNAVLRFRILWVNRYHVWSRLEEGAALCFKLPPPSIEYVLPSPTLGNPTVEVPDPAWKTRKGTSAEEVQLKQNEATKTFVTASTSRRKQQQELLARAVSAAKAQEDEARRVFHMTTCPVLELASAEAAFFKDHREEAGAEDGTVGVTNSVVQEEYNLAARKVSFAPMNRSLNMQSRSFSWRNGSIPIFRDNVTLMDDDESAGGGLTLLCTHQFQVAQCFFPSCLCAAALPLTDLLDDCAVSREGTAISTVAQQVIWQCLTEDTSLFLRNVFEKLTRAPHKDELICILRKLIQRLPELPMQTAHILFNNLVGCIMFYVRTPNFDAPDSIASVLCILHMIVPFVQNIYFKDLKQTLRREQIDGTLLVTANLPCAKQFNVFDDRICVAQLVKLQDDTKDYRFSDILSEALETNSVPQSEHHLHVLCDDRSNIIRNSSHYVRDFYPFKRNHIPKLKLMRVDKETGQQLLQRNAFSLKVQEVGKVLLFKTILQTTPMSTMSNHLMFLHEELVKLPSFPRKALETEFALCDGGEMGKPLLAIDTIHKLTWCQLLNSMFQKMPSTFPWSSELQLFLNVYNGTLVLHAEDASILRHCMAFYLQCAFQFKMVFSVNGYLSILPTIIRVYHHNLHNGILTQAIEFTCKHFYIMHRTPFILQMFGCIANYIDLSQDDFSQQNFYRVLPETLYRLLRTIGRDSQDSLGILQLCNFSKPLKALDFCYADDSQGWSIFEAVNLCVTVQVYAPESYRSRQMMVILQAIVPFILRDLPTICSEECSTGDIRKYELQSIQQLSVTIKQLICTTEWMTRRTDDVRSVVSGQSSHGSAPGGPCVSGSSVKRLAEQTPKIPEWTNSLSGMNLPARSTETHDSEKGVSFRRRRPRSSMGLKRSASSILNKRNNQEGFAATTATSSNPTPSGWRKSSVEPREAILQIASEFLTVANLRLTELGERHRFSDLLDGKAYMRLSELAQSIIKQFPYNPNLLKSQALQRFLTEVLPIVEWGHESLRSCKALETLVGRLSRTLPKMLDTPSIRKQVKWDCVTNIIKSLYMTAQRNRSVAQLKEIKIFAEYLKRSVVISPRAWCPPASERSTITSSQVSFKREVAEPSSGTGAMGGATYIAEISAIGSEAPSRAAAISGAGAAAAASARGFSSAKRRSRAHAASFLGSSPTNSKDPARTGSSRANTERTPEQGVLPASFVSEAVKFIALLLNVLGASYRLKDLCERTTLEYARCPTILEDGIESLSNYLAYLILPILVHGSTERTDFPSLSKENVFYALDLCLSALFVGVRKTGRPCPEGKQLTSALSTTISSAAATATNVVANAYSPPDDLHSSDAGGGTKKPLIPTSLILSSAKAPTFSALNELPVAGSLKAHFSVSLGSSVYPTAGANTLASSRLQTPGASGAGDLSWEPVCSASLACDLGAGKVYCSLVNLVSPTLHCLQQKGDTLVGDLLTGLGAFPATTTAAAPAGGIGMTGNSLVSPNPTVKFASPVGSDLPSGTGECNQQTQVDLLHKLAFLGLKLILVVYSRHSLARVRQINAVLAKLTFYRSCASQLWKFVDFIVTYRPSIFVHLLPFIRFQMLNINCETQGEQAFQQIIGQKLLGLHVPPQPTIVSLVKDLLLDLRVLQEEKRMLSLMCRRSALHNLPRSPPDGAFFPTSLAETVGSPAGLPESAGGLQHTSEKHFGLLEGAQIRAFSQAEFRQSLLRRTSGKRITAYDGSRFLSQQKSLSQGKPILTASVESLPRQSGRSSMDRQQRKTARDRGVLRRAVTTAGLPDDSYNQLESDTHRDRRDGSSAANRTKEAGQMSGRNPLEEDELDAPANPVLAAAVARSLYGSAAPYTQVREKAREELDDLIGISQPRLEASTASRQERLSQFSSGVGFAGLSHKDRSSKQKFESIPLAGLSTQRHRNHSSALPTPLSPEGIPLTTTTTTSDGASHHFGQSSTTTDLKDSDPLLKQAKVQYV